MKFRGLAIKVSTVTFGFKTKEAGVVQPRFQSGKIPEP